MENEVIFAIFQENGGESENVEMELDVRDDDDDDEDEDEEEEELIENADGTMTIKIPEKKEKPIKVEHLCAKCSLTFPTQAELKRHLNLCRNLPKDEIATRDEEDFANIDVKHKKYKKFCFCCNEDKTTAHYGHVKCNFCPKSFKSHRNLEQHLFLLHSTTITSFACTYCNAKCVSQTVFDAHMESHQSGKPFSCQRCGKDFTRKYHLDRHLQYTDCDQSRTKQEIPCHVCGKMFSRTDNLREHLRAHIGQSTRKRDYQCPHCEKSFYGSSLLNIHIRTHTGEKPFDCDLCEKSFPSNGALRKHRRSHTGEKPYMCKTCGKSFSAKETLNRHVKVHTGERPHKCTYCDKSFIQSTQLRAHMFNHTGENGFNCDHCDKKFNRKTRLENHMRKEHTNENNFQCDNCDQTFSKKKDLKYHQLTHESEDKVFICEKCDRPFTSKQSLLTHIRNHSKEACDQCGKKFNTKALAVHIEKVHGSTEDINEIDSKPENTIDIELVHEDSLTPNTYKIVCSDMKRDDTYIEILKIDEKPEPRKTRRSAAKLKVEKPYDDPVLIMDDDTLKLRVAEILKIVVDEDVLTKYGYPNETVENVLSNVLNDCDQKPINDDSCPDVGTKIRENVKLLFTTVIDDDSIKNMLNNHTIDEVINHVIELANN